MISKHENVSVSYISTVLSAFKMVGKFKMVRRIGRYFDNPKGLESMILHVLSYLL